jgi:glucose/arabinose dehydrogenase
MRRNLLVVMALATLLVGLPAEGSSSARTPSTNGPPAVIAEPVVEMENETVAFTFFPDGRVIYGERYTGRLFIFDPSTETSTFFIKVSNIMPGAERGLLGLAVHPQYPVQPYVYVYVTRHIQGGDPANQILRITDSGGVGTMARIIWQSDIPSNIAHNGGRILFGQGNRLYAVVGDAVDSANSQDVTNDSGKVHRMSDRGQPLPDNPFPGSTVWSYGHRNHFGLAFDVVTGNLWQAENGPHCNDEVNLIERGANYGWGPLSDANDCTEPPPAPENTNQDGPDPVLPEAWFTPTTAPVGMAFCRGCGLAQSQGTLFVGFFNQANIQRVVLTPDREDIQSITPIYQHGEFSVISLERAPDGAIHFNDFTTIYKLVEA